MQDTRPWLGIEGFLPLPLPLTLNEKRLTLTLIWTLKGDPPGCHFGAHTDDSEKEKCLRNKVVVVGSGSSQADQARALGIYWYWKHSVERKAKQAATADSIARARSPTQKAWSPDFSGSAVVITLYYNPVSRPQLQSIAIGVDESLSPFACM